MPITINVTCGVYGRKDVELTDEELKTVDENACAEQIQIMRKCISDAQDVTTGAGYDGASRATIAAALFATRARPIHYIREEHARAKFMAEREADRATRAAKTGTQTKMDTTHIVG